MVIYFALRIYFRFSYNLCSSSSIFSSVYVYFIILDVESFLVFTVISFTWNIFSGVYGNSVLIFKHIYSGSFLKKTLF